MPHTFQAIAVDYDGTLTTGTRPDAAVLDSVAAARSRGKRIVLVTGRILDELRHVFPGVEEHFDAIVAENGAVLSCAGRLRRLAPPVDRSLEDALTRRGVPVRGGEVLLACDASHDLIVLEEVHRLGLDCHLMYNRAALMVLPSGVSKGTGLYEALGDLGISHHSAIGIGDAENDHALLEVCELGVAVANAVPSLRDRADVVLDEPDGAGVASLLEGPILRGERRVHPRRWQLELGWYADGERATLPASQINLLITGGSGAGKSYAGGLFAEGLIQLGYSVLVVDFEGDHVGLGDLRGVWVFGDTTPLPAAADLPRILRHRFGCVVLDVSLLSADDQDAYVDEAAAAVSASRDDCGLPHWVIVDEAHRPFSDAIRAFGNTSGKGHCLITWRPDQLFPEIVRELDVVLALVSPDRDNRTVGEFLSSWAEDDDLLDTFADVQPGQALLWGGPRPSPALVTLADRQTGHVRHWHKYTRAELPAVQRFHFRRGPHAMTGRVAANLEEFHRILGQSGDDVVAHHCGHRDFSRWALQALRDGTLATSLSEIEGDHTASGDPGTTRQRLLQAIETRYLG